MEEKTVTGLFDEMKDDVTNYIKSTVELVKLESFEKISRGAASLALILIMWHIIVIMLALAFFTLGFYLGEILQSNWKGFGIVALGTLVLFLIILLAKKTFRSAITNTVVKFLMMKEDEEFKYKTRS